MEYKDIQQFKKHVYYNAYKFSAYSEDILSDVEDLIQVAWIGAMKGYATYELNKEANIQTYVIRCIQNELGMVIRYLRKDKRFDPRGTLSIYTEVDETENLTLEDMIGIDDIEFDKVIYMDIKQKLLNLLCEGELDILISYFVKMENQADIGKRYCLSQTMISRKIESIVASLRAKYLEMINID